MYIIGEGVIEQFKQIDYHQKVREGEYNKGEILNYIPCCFDAKPIRTYMPKSYATVAMMNQDSVRLMFIEFPDIKDLIKKKIIDNPYDHERTYFVNKCK